MNFDTFLIGLLICFLLSFLLGLERQIRRRFIGLRTMILVAIGSYMFVSFSFLIAGYQTDVSRIAAQVVAGIGFLGAGVIIKDNDRKIRGLTTAATLWCDASIGILCAGGFIKEAIVATMIVLFANIILRYVNMLINNKIEDKNTSETFLIIFKDCKDKTNKMMEYISTIDNKNDYIDSVEYKVDSGVISLTVCIRKNKDSLIDKYVNKIVTNFDIVKYEYKKISETKIDDDNEEL